MQGSNSALERFPSLVAFDLDDTLAPSKSPMPDSVAAELTSLLHQVDVCIISGGKFEQFQEQVLSRLNVDGSVKSRLHLMPTCGTQYYVWGGTDWNQVYAENLEPQEKTEIVRVLLEGVRELGFNEDTTWGDTIEDRGSQITFSALGQLAPHAEKIRWDPDGTKKKRLQAYCASRLPALEVRGGGSTSIDITRKGVDKAYGIGKLMAYRGLAIEDILFIGDRLDPGGNDYPVLAMGVRCLHVKGWEETPPLIHKIRGWLLTGSPALPPFDFASTTGAI